MKAKRTNLSDKNLIDDGYLYIGEHCLDDGKNPAQYATNRFSNGNNIVLYKTRISQRDSTKFIKIFVKEETK